MAHYAGDPGLPAWGDGVDAALASLRARVVNVQDFGVLPTNTAAANAAAIAARLVATSRAAEHWHFPPGDYYCDPIDLSMIANMTLSGVASAIGGTYTNGSGQAMTRLIFPGVTTGSCITVDGGYGFTARDLSFVSTNASFSGRMLDLRQVSGSAVTGLVTIEDCHVAGYKPASIATARGGIGIDLGKNVLPKINRVTVSDFGHGVQGVSAAGSFSIGASIQDCLFINNTLSHIHNPDQSWTISNPTYEFYLGGTTNAILQDSGLVTLGLQHSGGYAGDVLSVAASATAGVSDTTTFFNFLGTVLGVTFTGAALTGNTRTTGFYFATGSGIDISGNLLSNLAVGTAATTSARGHVGPNAYSSVTVKVSATTLDGPDIQRRSYTPALTAVTTDPTLGTSPTQAGIYSTYADWLDIEFAIVFGAGMSAGSGNYFISLPPNARAIAPPDTGIPVGVFSARAASTNFISGLLYYASATTLLLKYQSTATAQTQLGSGTFAWQAGDRVSGTARISMSALV